MTDHDDAAVDASKELKTELRLPPPADPLDGARRELADLTKRVLETGLEVEMTEHLGYEKQAVEGRDGANSRNGTRGKTVLTDIGPVDLDVPRDRDGTFEPATVRKRQRRLEGVDAMVISLCAKGSTTGEIAAHLAEVYGAQMSRETISKISDAVLEDTAGRPTTVTVPTGQRTDIAHDVVGRITSMNYSDATPDVTFSRDAPSNLTGMTDGVKRGRAHRGLAL